ncbi:hypothetical protein N665_0026s0034 [Sinapis alba]|nr:hypothetical protein N665_0026s0034 [Sinapis alba]
MKDEEKFIRGRRDVHHRVKRGVHQRVKMRSLMSEINLCGKETIFGDLFPLAIEDSLKDISQGPHESELRFQLIHFWEARNIAHAKTLIGLEIFIIDEQGTVMQGFIPLSRVNQYLRDLKPGTIYRLFNFFGSKSKEVYRVADHSVTVSISYKSVMSVLADNPFPIINEDRFRFHSHKEFEVNCDLKGDLYVPHPAISHGNPTSRRHPLSVSQTGLQTIH